MVIPTYEKYYLSVSEAGEYFSLTPLRITRIIEENPEKQLSVKIHGKVLVHRQRFEEYLDSKCNPSKIVRRKKIDTKDKHLISLHEASMYLSVKTNYVEEMCKNKDLPFIRKIGPKTLICRKELEEYLREHKEIKI